MKSLNTLVSSVLLASVGVFSSAQADSSARRFAQTCNTVNFHVEITVEPTDQSLTYSAWSITNGTIAAKPDLVLTKGSLAGGGGNYGIHFRNGDFSYTIQSRYVIEDGKLSYLQVYQGNELLVGEVCIGKAPTIR